MKITLRLVSACSISLLLVVVNHAEASLAPENLEQATEKETDPVSSIAQVQASLQRQPNNAKLYIKLGQAYWNLSLIHI